MYQTRKQLKREIERLNCEISRLETLLDNEQFGRDIDAKRLKMELSRERDAHKDDNFIEGCKSDMCRSCEHGIVGENEFGYAQLFGCDLVPKCLHFERKTKE